MVTAGGVRTGRRPVTYSLVVIETPTLGAAQASRPRSQNADELTTAGARVTTAETLGDRFRAVRGFTLALTAGLEAEDFVVQSMDDVSPTKWHLAHTTWFWEQFVLGQHAAGYVPFDPAYAYLFNSYYVAAGERHCRAQRGYLSRPTVADVLRYRAAVDDAVSDFLDGFDEEEQPAVATLVELGLHHEQQHQELMLTDIKHVLSVNPLRPVYRGRESTVTEDPGPAGWISYEPGLVRIGWPFEGDTARRRFAFDNEGPRHRYFVEPFEMADRLVTCGEFEEFIHDGGYSRPELWLSEGWSTVQREGWTGPFYREKARADEPARHFTLAGVRDVDPSEPITHVSYFEADAYARWAGARLPSEFEWEAAAAGVPVEGAFVESGRLHPSPALPSPGGDGSAALDAGGGPTLRQMFGEAWQWTQSQYTAYPGYRPPAGAVGEYNGKWMCNQFVLRGASCVTSRTHARRTYRNFFAPAATWQFTGIRLARSLGS
jgi:ergothioneine biosynthesis protein EgtB